MPVTYTEHDRKLKVPAVCELLPLRDLPLGDNVLVRTNGAFVAGYELRGILGYFATDGDRNQTKAMLEALFRSVPDVSMRIQFRYEISEHLGDLFDSYVNEQRASQPEVTALDAHRLRMWREKEQAGYFFENRLQVYYVWDPRIHAKLYHSAEQNRKLGGFTLSQAKAIQRARKEHETYRAEFESILRGIEGSMEAANLGSRRLTTQELFEELKHAQHPTRRDRRPYVPGEEMIEYRSAREQAAEASILNETETYLNIDGYLYGVVSLKELPDATFPGMLQNFSTLGFPIMISGQVVIPDQVKVLKSYKKRLQKMTAAQKDANGNFKSNPEAEVAQAQLIQVQRDIISSSLKTAKLELVGCRAHIAAGDDFRRPRTVGARTRQPYPGGAERLYPHERREGRGGDHRQAAHLPWNLAGHGRGRQARSGHADLECRRSRARRDALDRDPPQPAHSV